MSDHRAYTVKLKYSGHSTEKSCLVYVEDQYGTVWQDRLFSVDEFNSYRDFLRAVHSKRLNYYKHWVEGEKGE